LILDKLNLLQLYIFGTVLVGLFIKLLEVGMKIFVIIFTLLLITSCISTPNKPDIQPVQNNYEAIQAYKPTSANQSQAPTNNVAANVVDESPCRFVPGHMNSSGVYVPYTFECSENSIYATDINSCLWIAPYTKSDGTSVAGFHRCKYNLQPSTYSPASSEQNSAPCVSSYCGPVQVKGVLSKKWYLCSATH
jgi:hypothetical protein